MLLVHNLFKCKAFTNDHLKWKRYAGTYNLPDYQLHMLDKGPPLVSTITKEEAISMYTDMTMIRRMETSIADLYKVKVVRGFCHLYNGQEAIATGLFHSKRPEDTIITSYRAHAYAYLMGNSNAEAVISEVSGCDQGCSKGKGGSMHVYANKFYGGNGIVASQVPLGTGIAFSHKYTQNKSVSFTLYGDGAANQGQVFESFNIAKLWKLPVVYVCENNLYGMGTSTVRSSANTDYYKQSEYIPGILVDGMDILSVREATRFAIDFVEQGNGPIILEMRSYRYFGHSLSDPGSSYRTREEIVKMRKARDPIKKFGERIVGDQLVEEAELKEITKSVKKYMSEILRKVKTGKALEAEHLTADISKENLETGIRGVTAYQQLEHKNFDPPK